MAPETITSTQLAVELEAARRVVEDHFLAAGAILTRSVDGIDALIASLENLTKALDANAVAATTEDMRTASKALYGLADNHKMRQTTIEQLGHRRENLAKHVTDMRASLAYMRAFTVNIKIVSAGIAEAGSTFESFAQEISDCIESGRKELREVEEEIGSLQEGLSSALNEGLRLNSQLGTLLPALPNQLGESAGLMAQHYNSVHLIAGEVAEIARNIHKRVVRVLQALQIGDITRQRIEHVQDGLRQVEATGVPGILPLAHALLDRHLVATKEEFHREVGEIEKAMAEMAAHSREILRLRNMATGSGGGDSAGFLDELHRRIEEALVLVGEIEGADISALKTGRETASAAGHLGTRINAIQSLKNDVQYMALNTTIKCAQIGDAALPLSVIAIELRDHGRHLEDAAAGGLSELDELTASAGALASVGAEKTGLTATQALEVAARLIREARQATESEIGVMISKGEEVLKILDESVETLAFEAEIGGILERVQRELADLSASEPEAIAGYEAALAGWLSWLYELYTMRQERDVHNEFTDWLGIDLSEFVAEAPKVAVA